MGNHPRGYQPIYRICSLGGTLDHWTAATAETPTCMYKCYVFDGVTVLLLFVHAHTVTAP